MNGLMKPPPNSSIVDAFSAELWTKWKGGCKVKRWLQFWFIVLWNLYTKKRPHIRCVYLNCLPQNHYLSSGLAESCLLIPKLWEAVEWPFCNFHLNLWASGIPNRGGNTWVLILTVTRALQQPHSGYTYVARGHPDILQPATSYPLTISSLRFVVI